MSNTSTFSGKPNKKIQPVTLKNNIGDGLNREELISVAAYYHAEHRGFVHDDPMTDWLAAEAEIDAKHKTANKLK